MKKEYIILLAVIVALTGYLSTQNTDGTNYELPVLETIAADDVDRMEIKASEETLLFEKQGDGWTVDVEGFPARLDEVEKLVKSAGELSLTALVSEAESYSRYDLGPDKAKTVALFKGDTMVREFSMGKAAPSYQHTFVRVDGNNKVYHARGNFSGQFATEPERFIDKKVFSFTVDEINGLSVTKGEKALNVTRAAESGEDQSKVETAWKDEAGNTIDSVKVKNLLATLSTLSCEKWLVKKEEGVKPVAILTVTTDRPYTLELFGESPMQGTATERTFPFAISTATDASLMDAVTELLSDPPLQNEQAAN